MTCDVLSDEPSSKNVFLATGGYDHTVKLWQPHTGTILKTLLHPDSAVNCLCISQNGEYIYSGGYQLIRTYNVEASQHPVTVYDNIQKNITCIVSSKDGNWIVSSGEDGFLRIWDVRVPPSSSQLHFELGSGLRCTCLHSNQITVLAGNLDGILNLWNIKANKVEKIMTQSNAPLNSLSLDSQSTMVAGVNNNGECFVWSVSSNTSGGDVVLTPKTQFISHTRYGIYSKFSPDSTLLATCSADRTAKVWKTADCSLVTTLKCEKQRWVWGCSFSEDSRYLLTASSDGVARLWQIENSHAIREFVGHQCPVIAMDFRDEVDPQSSGCITSTTT